MPFDTTPMASLLGSICDFDNLQCEDVYTREDPPLADFAEDFADADPEDDRDEAEKQADYAEDIRDDYRD